VDEPINEEMVGYKVVTYQPQRLTEIPPRKGKIWVDICSRIDRLDVARSIAMSDNHRYKKPTRVMIATQTENWEKDSEE
jgi:hypothetical protein